MSFIYNDEEYMEIVNDILENKKFQEIKTLEHHGYTRYEHSLKVSYITYKLSKLLMLDYVSAARGGLLHDFFISENNRGIKERFVSALTHPFKAVENAKQEFSINAKEKNMIESHMFFANFIRLPKYLESWLVILSDTIIGTYELSMTAKEKAVTYASLAFIFLLNYTN